MASKQAPGTLRSARRGEAVFLVALLVAAGIAIVETFRFRSVPWDALGLAFWPRILLGTLIASAAVRLWRLRSDLEPALPGLGLGFTVLALCVAYVVSFSAFGVYLATPPFFLAFALLRTSYRKVRDVLVALAASGVVLLLVWGLFGRALELRVIALPYWMR